MKRKIVFPVIALSSFFLSGCFFGTNSSKLVPTESITTTTTTTEATTTTTVETTVETKETTTETSETTEETTETIENSTIESTVESNYKNNDIDFGNDKNAAETHKNHNGGTVKPTKAPDKKPASTKKPEPTKKPATTKAPTNTPKPTEKPKPTATPVPSKGTAIVKVKVTSHVYVDDESDEVEKHVDYFEIEATTSKWHTKTLSSYKYNGKVIDKKLSNKYGDNLQNYSAKVVEIVKFTN